MRAALAQLAPASGDPRANAARAVRLLEEHGDAQLLVLPELFLSGYDLERARASAVDPDGPELARVREAAAAAQTATVIGFAERRGTAVANALACIDERGELAAVYRKLCLFGPEADTFQAGDELVIVELAERRIGPLVCFDMEFPEPARKLALEGADLLVTAAANMRPYHRDHEIASAARALENRLPHLYVNRCGEEAGLRFVGGTRALAPDGSVLAEAVRDVETVVEAEVPQAGADDEQLDYLAQIPREIRVATQTTRGATR